VNEIIERTKQDGSYMKALTGAKTGLKNSFIPKKLHLVVLNTINGG